MSYKKPLSDWKKEYEDDTSTLSLLMRNLAFAGIGLIWIFKNTDSSSKLLPEALNCPILLIASALFIDLLQYIWRIGVSYCTYRKYEKLLNKGKIDKSITDDIQIDSIYMKITWSFFIFKIAFILFAYILIAKFLIVKI